MHDDSAGTGWVWPDRQQLLLLRAALQPEPVASHSWDRWCEEYGRLETVDQGTARLLPLVYCNLRAVRPSDERIVALRDRHRVQVIRNELMFQRFRAALETLRDAGHETLLLKGVALSECYYPDAGTRSFADLDVLVRESELHAAARVLETGGWRDPLGRLDTFDTRFDHAIALADDRGIGVDVHCHVLNMSCERGADREFWDASVPIDFRGLHTRTLCAEHHLVHVPAHGLCRSDRPTIYWIADAVMVLRGAGERLDWDRVVATAAARGVAPQTAAALGFLQRELDVEVPEETLRDLAGAPNARAARRMYELRRTPLRGHPVRSMRFHWGRLRRGVAGTRRWELIRSIPVYLRHWCAERHLTLAFLRVLAKSTRVLGTRLGVCRDRER